MIKLPYLSTHSKYEHAKTNLDSTLLPGSDITGFFRLKHMGKYVSHYQSDQKQDTPANMRSTQTLTSFHKASLLRHSFKVDGKQEIIQKAKNINNRHYPSCRSSNKGTLKTSASLDKKSLVLTQTQQNNLMATVKANLKQDQPTHSHSTSTTEIENKLQRVKNQRAFRSKWFTQAQQA